MRTVDRLVIEENATLQEIFQVRRWSSQKAEAVVVVRFARGVNVGKPGTHTTGDEEFWATQGNGHDKTAASLLEPQNKC